MAIEHLNKHESRTLLRTLENGDREYSHISSPSPINYETDAGTMKPINVNLNDYVDEVYDFGVSQVDMKVRFPNVETAPIHIYKNNGDDIKSRFKGLVFYNRSTGESQPLGTLKPQPIQYVALEESNEILYEDVYNGVDLKYIHGGHFIKQLVIISETFRNTLSIPAGWNSSDTMICKVNYVITSGSDIDIIMSKGLSYYDPDYAIANEVFIENNKITEGISWDFFNSGSGDFTINLTWTDGGSGGGDATTYKDSQILSDQPTTNFGTSTTIIVEGDSSTIPGAQRRSIFQFNVAVGAGATFSAATLDLVVNATVGTFTRNIDVHTIDTAWVEATVIWNAGTPWSSAGGDFSTPTKTFSVSDSDTSVSWDVLTIAQEWYTTPNNGLIVKFASEADQGEREFMQFKSSDHATAADRPLLTVTYTIANKPLGIAGSKGMGIANSKFLGV